MTDQTYIDSITIEFDGRKGPETQQYIGRHTQAEADHLVQEFLRGRPATVRFRTITATETATTVKDGKLGPAARKRPPAKSHTP